MARPREKCFNVYEGALRASLVIIISYPPIQSRIIVLSRFLYWVSEQKKSERKGRSDREGLWAKLNEFNETNREENVETSLLEN